MLQWFAMWMLIGARRNGTEPSWAMGLCFQCRGSGEGEQTWITSVTGFNVAMRLLEIYNVVFA